MRNRILQWSNQDIYAAFSRYLGLIELDERRHIPNLLETVFPPTCTSLAGLVAVVKRIRAERSIWKQTYRRSHHGIRA